MTAATPSLRQLQYLLALHEHRHFRRAAEACAVGQSTLSASIAELERMLGVTLVERTKRSVRFTRLGEAFAERAVAIVRGAEDLAELARASAAPLASKMTLAVIPTIAPFLLPRLLPRIAADCPDLTLTVRETTSDAACAALERGTVDCALIALPYACGAVEEAEIMTDRLLLGVGRARTAGPAITLDDIPASELLVLEDGHCLKDHVLAACGRERAGAQVVATSLHTLVQLVDAGLGVTLLPRLAVDAGLLDGTGVSALPLDEPQAARKIALVWRRGNARGGDFRLLADVIRGAMREEAVAGTV